MLINLNEDALRHIIREALKENVTCELPTN